MWYRSHPKHSLFYLLGSYGWHFLYFPITLYDGSKVLLYALHILPLQEFVSLLLNLYSVYFVLCFYFFLEWNHVWHDLAPWVHVSKLNLEKDSKLPLELIIMFKSFALPFYVLITSRVPYKNRLWTLRKQLYSTKSKLLIR